jgi:hypothetical protein
MQDGEASQPTHETPHEKHQDSTQTKKKTFTRLKSLIAAIL